MEKIMIRSNPYEQLICFFRWNDVADKWEEITTSNSDLRKDDYIKGFLPFKVEEILNAIIKDYYTKNEPIELVFEGTDDEFQEIEYMCEKEGYSSKLKLSRSNLYLENARDIFPDVVEIFEKIRPLISDQIQEDPDVKQNLNKFSDVSKDLIPICVLGNYSTGKSTFINGLVGWELLANSDEPLTARVYSIIKSPFPDRARIDFKLNEKDVSIRFEDKKYRITSYTEDDLIKQIDDLVAEIGSEKMLEQVSATLNFLNNNSSDSISDLIKIEIPFNDGLWNTSRYQFVIFDTPGSNTKSNEKHIQVLREAMKNLTNGLPVFVSEYNALDSIDNDNLRLEMEKMEGLDSRFAMIIVNKSDKASLPKDGFTDSQVDRILNQTLPKNLYSEGIFFVSSILGLGSKIQGDFKDDNYAEIYETEKTKYQDSTSRFYKKLFSYNIMPKQLKEVASVQAEKCENKIFANSGLYSVENEIQIFAQKYSAYNKCQQSKLFLGNVIERTTQLLEEQKTNKEATVESMRKNMEKEKRDLLDTITSTSQQLLNDYINYYDGMISPVNDELNSKFFQESLKDEQEELVRKQQEKNKLDDVKNNLKGARDAIGTNFSNDVRAMVKSRSFETFKKAMKTVGEDFVSDTKTAIERQQKLRSTIKEIDKSAGDDLIDLLNYDYYRYSVEAKDTIEDASINYWNNKAKGFKEKLIEIISGTSALEQKKKDEIEGIIVSYEDIQYNEEEIVFTREKFSRGLKVGRFTLGDSNALNLEKLKRAYNYEMSNAVEDIFARIKDSHNDVFAQWKTHLLNQIQENIVSYSPDLSKLNNSIRDQENEINNLETKKRKLGEYHQEIKDMMSWKEDFK